MEDVDGDADRIFSVEQLHHAVDVTHDQLESFQSRIHSRLRESVSEVFRAHLAILRDKDLMGWIDAEISAGRPAVTVIREAYGHHIDLFARSHVARLQEKAQDLQDIANRLVRNLLGRGQPGGGLHGRIVVVRTLFPSDLLRLVAQDAAGAVLMVYERLPYDVDDNEESWDDELDLPEFVLPYIEAGTLERAFSSDNDGFIPSLRDFWKTRKEIGINALKTYKRNRLKNRDYCIGASQDRHRIGSRLRLPSSYPRGY